MSIQRSSSIHWSQVWKVDLDPTAGCEIQKTGPCVVISRDYIGALPLRVAHLLLNGKSGLPASRGLSSLFPTIIMA